MVRIYIYLLSLLPSSSLKSLKVQCGEICIMFDTVSRVTIFFIKGGQGLLLRVPQAAASRPTEGGLHFPGAGGPTRGIYGLAWCNGSVQDCCGRTPYINLLCPNVLLSWTQPTTYFKFKLLIIFRQYMNKIFYDIQKTTTSLKQVLLWIIRHSLAYLNSDPRLHGWWNDPSLPICPWRLHTWQIGREGDNLWQFSNVFLPGVRRMEALDPSGNHWIWLDSLEQRC